jgi:hypothetical protein
MRKERRRFSRIFFNMPAVLNLGGISYTVPEICNLSVGGCLLDIMEDLPVGAECKITIYVEGTAKGLRIDIVGEIVRNDVNIVGVKFNTMSSDSYFNLTNIVKYRLPFMKYIPEYRSTIL